jgi:hypothetical protein
MGDLVPIMALSIPLVAVLGIAVRLTINPLMKAMAEFKQIQSGGSSQEMASLQRRLAAVEQHLETIDRSVGSLEAEADFRRQLESGSRHADPTAG